MASLADISLSYDPEAEARRKKEQEQRRKLSGGKGKKTVKQKRKTSRDFKKDPSERPNRVMWRSYLIHLGKTRPRIPPTMLNRMIKLAGDKEQIKQFSAGSKKLIGSTVEALLLFILNKCKQLADYGKKKTLSAETIDQVCCTFGERRLEGL